jgi:4-hydroxy-tetrahydrodipicolinate reductase
MSRVFVARATPVEPRARLASSRRGTRSLSRPPAAPKVRASYAMAPTVLAAAPPVPIMVNDLTGKMGRAVAESVVGRDKSQCFLVPVAFSGSAKPAVDVGGVVVEIKSIREDAGAALEDLKKRYPGMIVVDYTLPAAVNHNAELYVKHNTPFVMGTTGGDRTKLLTDVTAAKLAAVIAPQMGKQVVAFQAAMKLMAENFPGAFKGYTLEVTESHQTSKVDTSGTAKAIVQSFNDLGCGFDIKDVTLVRDVPTQLEKMNVPEEFLLGHAYHTYKLKSPDNTVFFEFQHNVCGRSIYAEGTVDAALFLSAKVTGGGETVYDMIDVLKEGGMVTN